MRQIPRLVAALACAVALAACGSGATSGGSAQSVGTTVLGRGFPGPGNVGVPPDTVLTPYDGPCRIVEDGTVIDRRTVDCALDIRAAGVVITNSKLNAPIGLDTDIPGSDRWSYLLRDSEVVGGTDPIATVGWGNMTLERVDVRGGPTSVQCRVSSRSCIVRDSWLHAQYVQPGSEWHLGGFLSNGGTNVELTGNTIVCDAAVTSAGGGCSGNINLFGDFGPISHVLVRGNLLLANPDSAYCAYGGTSTAKPFPDSDNVVFDGNVFQRGPKGTCGNYGPVTGFDVGGTGNRWVGNVWDDGTPVPPTL